MGEGTMGPNIVLKKEQKGEKETFLSQNIGDIRAFLPYIFALQGWLGTFPKSSIIASNLLCEET